MQKTIEIEDPRPEEINYNNPISGFGFRGGTVDTESYVIFKSGRRSNHRTSICSKEFTEIMFDQCATPIRRMKIYSYNEKQMHYGLLLGIELFDSCDGLIASTLNRYYSGAIPLRLGKI